MNRYQKLMVCIFRSIGLLGFGYLLAYAGTMVLVMPTAFGINAWPLVIPYAILLTFLYFGAIPLAKIVTIGITDD